MLGAFWGATNRFFCDSLCFMDSPDNALLEENIALKAALAVAVAKNSEDAALIAAQKLHIAKLIISILILDHKVINK
jgi:hypothetical protein